MNSHADFGFQDPLKYFFNQIQHQVYWVQNQLCCGLSTEAKVHALVVAGRVLQGAALVGGAASLGGVVVFGPVALVGLVAAIVLGVYRDVHCGPSERDL